MTSPTQGEHAQTEALRPKFGDLLRNTMASESNPRRDAYFIREVHRSGGGVNPGRWFEMTDGKGETWLSNPQNMVPAAPAQPAAPQGGAEVNWWEADGDKYDASISPMQPAQGVAYAELRKEFDLWWNDQMGNEPGRDTSSDSRAFMPYKAWKKAAERASHGQAPAGAAHEKVDPWGHAIAQEERACRAEDALIDLVNQIRKTSPVDDHGHLLTMNMAYIKSVQLLDSAASTPTAQAAPAAGAVAGMPPGIGALMCVISSLRDTAHFSDEEGELTDELRTLRDWAMTQAAAPTPAAQADSVLEDAARLDWLALAGPTSICVVLDRENDGEVEVSTDDATGYGKTLREALDAARKQGGA